MAKYTIRQYRQKLKTFEKRLNEYVSYKGRIYNQKYNEFQERIERMERMIKNRTYTQLDLNNMMRSLEHARVTDYVVQYDPVKDKFVNVASYSSSLLPVYEKREGKVPSIHEVKREAIEEYNKWLPEEPEPPRPPRPPEPPEEPPKEPPTDPPYDGTLFIEILLYLEKQFPKGLYKELHDAMLSIADDIEKIREFEAICNERGVDTTPTKYDLASQQMDIMGIVLGKKASGKDRDVSNVVYDNQEFTS